MRLVGDIESNELLYGADHIWMCLNYDLDENIWWIYSDCAFEWKRPEQFFRLRTMDEMLKTFDNAEEVLYHNGFGYDYALLEKLYGWEVDDRIDKLNDTFIMSSLFLPRQALGPWP
jgi:hypothetical protein